MNITQREEHENNVFMQSKAKENRTLYCLIRGKKAIMNAFSSIHVGLILAYQRSCAVKKKRNIQFPFKLPTK